VMKSKDEPQDFAKEEEEEVESCWGSYVYL
jgi:hypothetical protein